MLLNNNINSTHFLYFYSRVGYKEKEVTIDTKREQPAQREGGRNKDEPFREDELPAVVMGSGVSVDEYHHYIEESKKEGVAIKHVHQCHYMYNVHHR